MRQNEIESAAPKSRLQQKKIGSQSNTYVIDITDKTSCIGSFLLLLSFSVHGGAGKLYFCSL